MYKIKINKWTTKVPQKDGTTVDKEESLLDAITIILGTVDTGKGFDNFMSMHKIAKSFEDCDKSKEKILSFEKTEYDLVKKLMQENMPSQWAMHKKLSDELFKFFDLKQ